MIRWMAEHKVAANLLMMIIIFTGVLGVRNIKQEVFPEMELDFIVIAVPYSGATPEEIEKSILLPIEDAIKGLNGIKKVAGNATEGIAKFRVEIENNAIQELQFISGTFNAEYGQAMSGIVNIITKGQNSPITH